MGFRLENISYTVLLLLLLTLFVIRVNMSSISSDVEYLRQQYNAGKNQKDKLVVQYNNKQFQDGDELKKADTQITPNVQINVETDPQNPYFTLVNFYKISKMFFLMLSFLS